MFTYFEAPTSEMTGYVRGPVLCAFCAKISDGFELRRATCPGLSEKAKESAHGCILCLKEGRFEFFHDTEFGFLNEEGFERYYKGHKPAPEGLTEAARVELRRTPTFPTWQQFAWLGHCTDFMVYLGPWKPGDFERHAKDGDGRALFLAMTEPDLQHLWEASMPEKGGNPTTWHATYYAFRCRQCGGLRGNWDCD